MSLVSFSRKFLFLFREYFWASIRSAHFPAVLCGAWRSRCMRLAWIRLCSCPCRRRAMARNRWDLCDIRPFLRRGIFGGGFDGFSVQGPRFGKENTSVRMMALESKAVATPLFWHAGSTTRVLRMQFLSGSWFSRADLKSLSTLWVSFFSAFVLIPFFLAFATMSGSNAYWVNSTCSSLSCLWFSSWRLVRASRRFDSRYWFSRWGTHILAVRSEG